MCLRDDVDVLKEQLTILDLSGDVLFRPIGRSTGTAGTLVQTEPMQSSNFHIAYKAICQLLFPNTGCVEV